MGTCRSQGDRRVTRAARPALSALLVLVLAGGFTTPSLAKPTPPPTPIPTSAPGAKLAAPPTPTPQPIGPAVIVPTSIPTPAPPTDTPIPTTTNTPLPTSTPTDTPTPTPPPTATATCPPTNTPTPTPVAATMVGGIAAASLLLLALPALGAGGVLGLVSVARAVRSLEHTYRRQKSLELEQMQAQAVAQRRAEVEGLLAREGGWRLVLNQVLADALPEARTRIGQEGVLDLNFAPAPRFTVAGVDGRTYLFTIAPDLLRRAGMLKRREQVVVLDAALSPAVRQEVQAVWDHLASQRLREQAPVLPRQAEWFLIVREAREAKGGRR
jgi:hypothetical protein